MDESERKKAIELIREMRDGGETNESQGNEKRLTWMYKGPSDLIDKEEYLLGKAIDKSFDTDKNGDGSDVIGRNFEASNVPKRLLSKPESTEQVDIAKKILEDPLYAIKQKEMEARRRLLDNPVKLKELRKMIMERNMQKLQEKKRMKKQRKKDAMKDEKYLDKLILKKLKMLSEKQRKKLLEEAAEVSDSSDSHGKKGKKRRKKKRRSESEQSPESSGESDASESSDDSIKKKKRRNKLVYSSREQSQISARNARGTVQRNRGDEIDKKNKRSALKKGQQESSQTRRQKNDRKKSGSKSSRSESSSSSGSSSSESSGSVSSSDSESCKEKEKSRKINVQHEKDIEFKNSRPSCSGKFIKSKKVEKYNSLKKERKGDKNRRMKKHYSKSNSPSSDSEGERSQKKRSRQDYNHRVKDWSRGGHFSQRENSRHDRNYRQKLQTSSSHSKQVSDKEREAKLKEMMANAKVRKMEREQNLANHRKVQSEEEKLKDYDDGFLRRQISQATSHGTVADRIRANVNNIQRSKADMDRSFVRK